MMNDSPVIAMLSKMSGMPTLQPDERDGLACFVGGTACLAVGASQSQ